MQDVQTNAVRVHCHSGPSAALEIGFGYANVTERKAAALVSVTAAAIFADRTLRSKSAIVSMAGYSAPHWKTRASNFPVLKRQ